ncbi:MAG TPA: hypothetical protein VF534_17860 [Paraburkholderia sp.]
MLATGLVLDLGNVGVLLCQRLECFFALTAAQRDYCAILDGQCGLRLFIDSQFG